VELVQKQVQGGFGIVSVEASGSAVIMLFKILNVTICIKVIIYALLLCY
jgi:hypothetical protein